MPNVYIEPRPRGAGTIEKYVVEDHHDQIMQTAETQAEAIEWARKDGHHPLVARVRHLNDKKVPGHWRSA